MVIQILNGWESNRKSACHAQCGIEGFPSLPPVKVGEHFADASRQTEFSIKLAHQQQPAVAADDSAFEIEMDFSTLRTLKYRIESCTFCHRQSFCKLL